MVEGTQRNVLKAAFVHSAFWDLMTVLCTVGGRVFADQCAVFPNASYATTADLEFSKELVVRVVDDCLSFF